MKTVLLLSTYPFAEPRHGGQVRMENIAKAYRSAGWNVESVAVYEPEGYGPNAVLAKDIPFPPDSESRKFRGRYVPLITDLLTGDFASSDDGCYRKVLANISSSISVIHVEQPWLWPLVSKLKAESQYRDCLLIYGSQNIEGPLKQEILASYNVADAADVIAAVSALEIRAALEADISLAVTEEDFDVLESWGASNVVLAPNGIAPWHAREERLTYWKEKLPKSPWILYVASAHPPNFTGFNECLGSSLACIPPDSRLVVAGSVGEHLAAALNNTRWGSLNMSRLQLLFLLSDEDLAAVKTLAHAFLLPIPHGGGSNIKTAEAIFSGKYVIGTEAAFRGYQSKRNLRGVMTARTPQDFHTQIKDVLTIKAPFDLKDDELDQRESLTWTSSLASIIHAIEQKNCSKELR